ncbi:hypothetical protein KKA14_13185 [bacterium]|nr:hypothetical protein [bacterium]
MRCIQLAILITVFLLAGCGILSKGALYGARNDIENKEYVSALNNLTDANFSDLSEEQKEEVSFLRAKALYGLNRTEEALAVLTFMIEKYPDSKFGPQAKGLLKKWSEKISSK